MPTRQGDVWELRRDGRMFGVLRGRGRGRRASRGGRVKVLHILLYPLLVACLQGQSGVEK